MIRSESVLNPGSDLWRSIFACSQEAISDFFRYVLYFYRKKDLRKCVGYWGLNFHGPYQYPTPKFGRRLTIYLCGRILMVFEAKKWIFTLSECLECQNHVWDAFQCQTSAFRAPERKEIALKSKRQIFQTSATEVLKAVMFRPESVLNPGPYLWRSIFVCCQEAISDFFGYVLYFYTKEDLRKCQR